MNIICSDLTENVTSVPSIVHQIKSGSHVSQSQFQSVSNADKAAAFMKVSSAGYIFSSNYVQPMEAEATISQNSTTNNNTGKSVHTCRFRCEYYELVVTTANLGQIMEVRIGSKRFWTSPRKWSGSPSNAMDLLIQEVCSLSHVFLVLSQLVSL